MGKLTELVSEDISLAEKMKINARKIGLAGVGLASIVSSERSRLYRQIMEMGESYGGADTLVGRLSLIGTGTVNLVREETLKVFDELVVEGEQALAKSKPAAGAGVVARQPPKASTAKQSVKKSEVPRAVTKPNTKQAPSDIVQRLESAQAEVRTLAGLSAQDTLQLNALAKQITEGDVKGRKPAQSKVAELAEFDARRQLKGMKPEEALNRYEALLKRLLTEPVE
jgi:diazepam-binding inhibitor (GABA receptor modulating acyl-CoA-binding protein)